MSTIYPFFGLYQSGDLRLVKTRVALAGSLVPDGEIFVASNPIGQGVGDAVLLYGGGTMLWDAHNDKK